MKRLSSAWFLALSTAFAVTGCLGIDLGLTPEKSSGAGGSTYLASTSTTRATIDANACFGCGNLSCGVDAGACSASPLCLQTVTCLLECGSTDVMCGNQCVANAGTDAATVNAAARYRDCLLQVCSTPCQPRLAMQPTGFGGSTAFGTALAVGGTTAIAVIGRGGATATTGTKTTANVGGATSSVNYRCQGTKTITSCTECTGASATCVCNEIPGCSGTASFTCSGTPTVDCSTISNLSECAYSGCIVDYAGTTGNPCYTPTCAELSGDPGCARLPGCKMSDPNGTCAGTPTACSQLTTQTCASMPGCSLVRVP